MQGGFRSVAAGMLAKADRIPPCSGMSFEYPSPIAIALMGPTASGKSALALDWAQRFGGEIVSVDSALVGTAGSMSVPPSQPRRKRASVPHHLIDLRDPWQPYSAADYSVDARDAIAGIVARGGCRSWREAPGCIPRDAARALADADRRSDVARRACQRSRRARLGSDACRTRIGRSDRGGAHP